MILSKTLRVSLKAAEQCCRLLAVFGTLLLSEPARAITLYWDNNSSAANTGVLGTGNWDGNTTTSLFWNTDSTGGNGGSVQATTTGADDLIFSSGTALANGTVTLSITQAANKITFEESGVYTLTGGQINLGAGGLLFSNGTGANVIATTLALTADTVFTNNDNTNQTVSGNVTGNFGVTVTGAGNAAVVLSGTNTINSLKITSGIAQLGNNSNNATLAAGATITLGDTSGSAAATLQLQGSTANFAASNGIVLGGSTGVMTIRGVNGGATSNIFFNGGVTGTGNIVIQAGASGSSSTPFAFSTNALNNVGTITNLGNGSTGSMTINSQIGANVTGVIQNSSTSRLILNGTNLYTGPTTITAGILQLGGSLANTSVTAAAGTTFLVTGNSTVGTSGSGSVTVAGSATGGLSLVSSTVNTLTINSVTPAATVLTLGGPVNATQLNMELGATADSIVLGTGLKAAIGAGGVNVVISALGGKSSGTYTLVSADGGGLLTGGSFTMNNAVGNFGGATLSLNVTDTEVQLISTVAAAATNAYWGGAQGTVWNLYTGGNANNTSWLDAPAGTDIHAPIEGTTNVFMTANAATNLATTLGQDYEINSLTFTGTGTVGTAAVSVGGTNTLKINATSANGNTAGVGIMKLAGSGISTVSAPVVLGGNQRWINNASTGLVVSGAISGTGDLTLEANDNTGTITISAAAINHTGSIANAGTGTNVTTLSGAIGTAVTGVTQNSATSVLLLSGANTFTGPLNVQLGTVRLGSATGAGAGVVTIGGAGTSGVLDINGGSRSVGGLATAGVAANQIITNGHASALGTVNYNGATTSSFGGVIQNGATAITALTVNNAAADLTLTGTNTYTGLTTVTAGTLRMGSANAIVSGSNVTTGAAGIFDLNGFDRTITVLNNAGNVTNSGATKTLTIGNASTGAGSFTGAMNLIWNQVASSTTLSGTTAGMTGNVTLNNTAAGSIAFTTLNHTGIVTHTGAGGGATTLTNIGSNVTQVIQNSTTSQLNINGTGNSFGSLFIKAGTVVGSGNNTGLVDSLGTGLITLGDTGGSLAATLTGNGVAGTIANDIELATGASLVLTIGTSNSTNSFNFTGDITGNNNLRLFNGGSQTLNFTGGIDNAGTVTNVGTGSGSATITASATIGSNLTGLIQNGTNTFNVNAAMALTAANNTLLSTNSGAFNFGGAITGSQNLTINANSATVTGGNITVSGLINNAGTVTISGTSTVGVTNLSGGIGSNVTGITNSAVTATTIGAIALGQNIAVNNASAALLTLNGGSSGGAFDLNLKANTAAGITSNSTAMNHTGTITNSGTGAGTVTVGSVGSNVTGVTQSSLTSALTVTALSANSTTGTTLTNNAGVGATKVLTVTNAVGGTGNLVLDNDSALTGGIVLTGGAANAGSITNLGSGGSVTITGAITTAVTGGVFQNSATSTLLLNGANTFTSGLNVQQGTVQIGATAGLGAGLVTIGGTGTSGVVDLNGASRTINSLATAGIAANQTITNNHATTAATLNYTGATTSTYGGVIKDGTTATTALTVNNAAANLTLSGVNAYTGATTITSGILNLTGSLSSSNISVAAAGRLNIGNASALGTGTLSFAGGIVDNSSGGTLVNTQNNAISIATTGLTFGGTNDLDMGTGNVTLAAGSRTFTLNGSGRTLTLGGTVSSTTATGTTTQTVNGVGNTLAFGSYVLNSDTTLRNHVFSGSGNLRINGGLIAGTNASSVTYSGTGTMSVGGNSNYTGTTTVSSGSLKLLNGGNLGNTAVTVSNSGTFGITQNASGTSNILSTSASGITMNAGSTFTMVDGFTSTANVTTANLYAGTASVAPSYYFELSSTNGVSDVLAISGAASFTNGGGLIELVGLGPLASGNTYTIATAASGLNSANTWALASGRVSTGFNSAALVTLTNNATSSVITIGQSGLAAVYYTGAVDGATLNATSVGGTVTNFSSDVAGMVDAGSLPGSITDVHFSATTVTTPQTIASLGQDFTFNSLIFDAGAAAITINNGGGYNLDLYEGITVASGSGAHTLNVPVRLVTGQTFTNNNAAGAGGALTIGGPVSSSATSGTHILTIDGTGDIVLSGGVSNGSTSTLALTKTGTGTVTLQGLSSTASSNYSGLTTLGGGTAKVVGTGALSGAMTFGQFPTSTAVSALDLSTGSLTLGGALTVQTNNASANTITIGNTQSLNVSGNVVIGSGASANTTTALTVTGDGEFNVTNAASTAVFTVGGTSTSGVGNIASANFSGLASMNITMTHASSVILVSPNIASGTTNVANLESVLRLAAVTTLRAGTLTVGGGPTNAVTTPTGGPSDQLNELYLGSTSNDIRVNTFNIGTGTRDSGSVKFAGATGTITIRNSAGTGRAAFNMGTSISNTASAAINTFDVTGHNADLLLAAVNMGTQPRGNAIFTNTFSFDQGTLDMTSLTMSARTGVGSTNGAIRVTDSVMNLGGGTVIIQNGVLAMAKASGSDYASGGGANPVMNATLNISGGNVTIGATSGTAISMVDYTASGGTGTGGATGLVNITGGDVTVNGDIVRVNSAVGTSATVTLNGTTASLDMAGNDIGTSTNLITFNALQGTLRNLGELNGGGQFVKSGTGILVLDTANAYTGGTNVTAGTLLVKNTAGSATGTGATSIATTGTLAGNGTLGATGQTTTVNGSMIVGDLSADTTGDLTIQGNLNLASTSTSTLEIQSLTAGDFDRIIVGQDLTIDGSLTLDFSALAFGTYNNNFTLDLMDWGNVNPFLSTSFDPDVNITFVYNESAAGSWDTSAFQSTGVIGWIAVPEPGRAVLMLLGMAGIFLRRRR